MRLLILFSSFLFSCSLCAQTFTKHLEKSVVGEGNVTLYQSEAITRQVNGVGQTETLSQDVQKKEGDSEEPIVKLNADGTPRRMKMMGYRIQIYAGASSRESKMEAQRAAKKVKSYFAEHAVYTHFYSPRWICRMGDFKTMQEAVDVLQQMKSTKKFNEATIVKSQIIVPVM